MEQVMPELVGLVFTFVEPLSLVACRFVCRSWNRHLLLLHNKTQPQQQGSDTPRQRWRETDEAELGKDYCKLVAVNGWLSALKWARANGSPWDERACHWAAEGRHAQGGQLEVLLWAYANGCPWSDETCAMAGLSELRQWVIANTTRRSRRAYGTDRVNNTTQPRGIVRARDCC